jgi:hypothetical protein
MKQLADGVWLLSGFPPNVFNVYLIEDVLIDAGTRHAGRHILRQLKGTRCDGARAHPGPPGPLGRVERGVRYEEVLGFPEAAGLRRGASAEGPG